MARAPGGHCVAVASRDSAKAERFVAECQAITPMLDGSENPVAVDSVAGYQTLLDRSDIDAVYIPLPTGIRKSWVIAAAKAGKHVLSEKPAAIHHDDLEQMVAACDTAGVQFMDGVMFDHSIRLQSLLSKLDSQNIGQIRRIQSHFSFFADDAFADENIRAAADLEPHGCLGDLGWYCVRLTLWVSQFEMPSAVRGQSLWSVGDNVPGEFAGEMRFGDQTTASFFCSFRAVNQQTASITGETGYASVDDFVLPFTSGTTSYDVHRHQVDTQRCRWHYNRCTESTQVDEYSSGESTSQEVRMIERMNQIAIQDTPDASIAERSLKTQQIVDAMRRSDIGGGGWIDLP